MRHTDFTKTSRSLFASALLVPLLLAGCGTPEQKEKPATVELSDDFIRGVDRQMTRQPFEDQARRGVVRQRTLYDYHFNVESAELTSLARRDLQYLLEALGTGGARLSVRRGPASADLYAARVTAVRDWFVDRGVASSRILIDDGPPGGPGVSSVDAIAIRAEIKLKPFKVPSGTILTPLTGREEK